MISAIARMLSQHASEDTAKQEILQAIKTEMDEEKSENSINQVSTLSISNSRCHFIGKSFHVNLHKIADPRDANQRLMQRILGAYVVLHSNPGEKFYYQTDWAKFTPVVTVLANNEEIEKYFSQDFNITPIAGNSNIDTHMFEYPPEENTKKILVAILLTKRLHTHFGSIVIETNTTFLENLEIYEFTFHTLNLKDRLTASQYVNKIKDDLLNSQNKYLPHKVFLLEDFYKEFDSHVNPLGTGRNSDILEHTILAVAGVNEIPTSAGHNSSPGTLNIMCMQLKFIEEISQTVLEKLNTKFIEVDTHQGVDGLIAYHLTANALMNELADIKSHSSRLISANTATYISPDRTAVVEENSTMSFRA